MDFPIFRLAASGRFHKLSLDRYRKDVNSLSNLKSTPLHYAILGGNEDTVRYLVKEGARVNTQNVFLESVLHWACKEGNLNIIRFLLQHKAHATALDYRGNSPMHWAAECDNDKVVLLLLEFGGRPSRHIKNDDGHTPRQVAKRNQSKKALTALRRASSRSHPHLSRVP